MYSKTKDNENNFPQNPNNINEFDNGNASQNNEEGNPNIGENNIQRGIGDGGLGEGDIQFINIVLKN